MCCRLLLIHIRQRRLAGCVDGDSHRSVNGMGVIQGAGACPTSAGDILGVKTFLTSIFTGISSGNDTLSCSAAALLAIVPDHRLISLSDL